MKLSRYYNFLSERSNNSKYNSLGEWVETLIDDEYVKNIVSRYTKDIPPDIKLSNAINILDSRTRNEIEYQIREYLKNGIRDKKPTIIASTVIDEMDGYGNLILSGRRIFLSFLKSLTALGQKMVGPDWENCPNDYLIFYLYKNLDPELVKSIFSRFRSLSRYNDIVNYNQNGINLYMGIKCDGSFQYGIRLDDKLIPIGEFRLSKSVMKWMMGLESKSAHSLKGELSNLTYDNIITLGKIKTDMKVFNPGYHEKKLKPVLKDNIISFGYYGVGKWDNGKLDDVDFYNIKNNFIKWLLTKKWGNKVLLSIKSNSFWLYIHLKLK